MKEKIFSDLEEAMLSYDEDAIKTLVKEAISNGINPLETINILTNSIAKIGKKFSNGELFLPDLMLSAKTMQLGMSLLEQELLKKGLLRESLGRVVIGTVFGDLHNIGKNMVATLLNAAGFEVIDLGVNVKAEIFIEAIKKHKPNILAMSALLTTTAVEQGRVIKFLQEKDLRKSVKVMVGGGPVTAEFAKEIGADGYEPTAILAVELAKQFIE